MADHRGGTVTFVFTDIEGSTRLVQEFKERWPEVRSAHRRIVREAFGAHGGDEVDTQGVREAFGAHGGDEVDTQGDSFFYVFGRARDAALAAADAQRCLAGHDWPLGGEVRIRVGMHKGEPVVSEEGYHGIGVHRAARIMAAGHGGQVLLSEATAAVLRDEEVSGVGVRDLGVHRLKDLDRPEHVYQLVADGLEQTFPKIRTAGEQKAFHIDAALNGWIQDYPAPSNFFSGIGCPTSPYLCSATYASRLARARAAAAATASNMPWTEFDRLATDQAWVIPYLNLKANDFVSKRVGNYQHHPEFDSLIDQVWVQ